MPVLGRTRTTAVKSNIVRNLPILPIPMYYGKVSFNVEFEGLPSGSLEYNGIAEEDLPEIERAYAPGSQVALYGIPLRVTSYAYLREGYSYRNNVRFSVYQVSVGLGCKYERALDREVKLLRLAVNNKVSIQAIANAAGVPYRGPVFFVEVPANADKDFSTSLRSTVESQARIKGCYTSYTNGIALKRMSLASSWSFPEEEIITDGQNTLQLRPAYNRAELIGAFNDTSNDTDSPISLQFTYADAQVEQTTEESDRPDRIPPDTTVLRGLDSVFDVSGPKKIKKITTQMWGNPDSEEIWTYGFVYTASDMIQSGDELAAFDPQRFWQVIEYQKTQYVYKALPDLRLSVLIRDPVNPSKRLPAVVHPDYEQFVSVDLFGGTINFATTVSYLTEINATGWKLARLAREGEKEPGTYESRDPEHPYHKYCFFKKIPTDSKTRYSLKSARSLYGDDIGAPFSVDWVDYNELDPRLKDKVRKGRHLNELNQVAVLTPDPNYVEPMLVMVESSRSSSFAYAPDPESNEDNPLFPLTTGEESHTETSRTILTPTKYRERILEFSSQDPGFSTSMEEIRFRTVLGRPPEAQYRMAEAKEVVSRKSEVVSEKIKKYWVTSDESKNAELGGSISYPEARTLQEAITAAKLDLQIAEMNNSQATKTLTWFYPEIRDGDRVFTGKDRFSTTGQWRVKNARWELEYNGINNAYSGDIPLVTCEGTQLTLGLMRDRTLNYYETTEANPDATGGEVQVEITGGDYSLGGIVFNSSNRRKFSV